MACLNIPSFPGLDSFFSKGVYPVYCNMKMQIFSIIMQTINSLMTVQIFFFQKYIHKFFDLGSRGLLSFLPAKNVMRNRV